jgi:hypothetical protein
MQDHPTDGRADGARSAPGQDDELKRWLLFELVCSPPAEGDHLDYLARALKEKRTQVEAAVDALVADGLAERDADFVRASTAAWRFEALWPIRA